METRAARVRAWEIAVVGALLLVLLIELTFSIRRESQTFDEACHIFAGYRYWKDADFGQNPEHPPLVKLIATLPLLHLSLKVPSHPAIFSKEEDFWSATAFVYGNDAEQILFRTRMMAAMLTLLLGLVIFLTTREMFGAIPGLIALALFTFEPNLLAHGALVTTDSAMACFLLASVYAFYRYVKNPTAERLITSSIAAGLALATKHSAILLFPILGILVAGELLATYLRKAPHGELPQQANRVIGGLAVIGVVSVAILWTSYGFHYRPRAGIDANPRFTEYVSRLKNPVESKMILLAGDWHLLPQSYLYGLADVGITAEFSHAYLLGKTYLHGNWFYFPVAFSIKTTLGLLILLALAPLALWRSRVQYWRELMFIAVPAAIYFLVAIGSSMNIGVRHILPIYPFCMVLAAWAAWQLIQRKRAWAYVVGALLLWNAVSSLRAYPAYMAYANELWGGPSQAYRYLTDSNVDWGQQLKSTRQYLDSHHVENCWFAYTAEVVVDPTYYGVHCKPLTTIASVWLQPTIDVPATIDGTVLISAGVLSGYGFGPGELNPYDQFQRIRPTAVIENGVFVYDGHFDIPVASALNHVTRTQLALKANRREEAMAEAQAAATIAPRLVEAQAQLGVLLAQSQRNDEARAAFQQALLDAETIQPEFRRDWIIGLRRIVPEAR